MSNDGFWLPNDKVASTSLSLKDVMGFFAWVILSGASFKLFDIFPSLLAKFFLWMQGREFPL
ncbi:hypothetical protein C1752_07494 [Acaryochloris thomasi RCC1774]|uniref:Uncharacterized protein n=1 Tax=Acaryochloris thomasi RCC1774 TaxID=1764569 RepID=A0A2W1JB84_9CYAN|nr:hypothetical protein [Acaryochloris thomasi]PZD71218.1 hypothetical protein C1752_07494 [Acaryochloris thomasi RCC1774]